MLSPTNDPTPLPLDAPPRPPGMDAEWRLGLPSLLAVARHGLGDEGWGAWCCVPAGGGIADRRWLRVRDGVLEVQAVGECTALPFEGGGWLATGWWRPSSPAGDLMAWGILEDAPLPAAPQSAAAEAARQAALFGRGWIVGSGVKAIESNEQSDPEWQRGWRAGRDARHQAVEAARARLGLGPSLLLHLVGASEAGTAAAPPTRSASRRVLISHIWNEDGTHAYARFTLRDPETDVQVEPASPMLLALVESLGLTDGDEAEITVHTTGGRPMGDRRLRFRSAKNRYVRDTDGGVE